MSDFDTSAYVARSGLTKRSERRHESGFTIVELLIVIVVIGILAAIVVTTFQNVNAKARDADRKSAINTIVKALELHYIDKGYFPNATNYTPGSTVINNSWSTTADSSWNNLRTVLQPYASKLPTPPTSSSTAAISGGDNYDYFGFANSTYCGSSAGQGYILVYHLEGVQTNVTTGTCSGTPLGYYSPSSNYRVVK